MNRAHASASGAAAMRFHCCDSNYGEERSEWSARWPRHSSREILGRNLVDERKIVFRSRRRDRRRHDVKRVEDLEILDHTDRKRNDDDGLHLRQDNGE